MTYRVLWTIITIVPYGIKPAKAEMEEQEVYSVQQVKENAVIELLSWDAPVTTERVISTIQNRVTNLYSHIGKAAHEHEAQFVDDLTGMSWEEQDRQAIEQISDYEAALADIRRNPPIDWKPMEDEMLQWMRTH